MNWSLYKSRRGETTDCTTDVRNDYHSKLLDNSNQSHTTIVSISKMAFNTRSTAHGADYLLSSSSTVPPAGLRCGPVIGDVYFRSRSKALQPGRPSQYRNQSRRFSAESRLSTCPTLVNCGAEDVDVSPDLVDGRLRAGFDQTGPFPSFDEIASTSEPRPDYLDDNNDERPERPTVSPLSVIDNLPPSGSVSPLLGEAEYVQQAWYVSARPAESS